MSENTPGSFLLGLDHAILEKLQVQLRTKVAHDIHALVNPATIRELSYQADVKKRFEAAQRILSQAREANVAEANKAFSDLGHIPDEYEFTEKSFVDFYDALKKRAIAEGIDLEKLEK